MVKTSKNTTKLKPTDPTDAKEVAQVSHKACHMPGNKNGPDLDKGAKKEPSGASDLA